MCQRHAPALAATPHDHCGPRGGIALAFRAGVISTPASDPALLARLSDLIGALETERLRLAGRLAAIEEELGRLASAVASREDLRDASPRP
jgi:hypothetical protein